MHAPLGGLAQRGRHGGRLQPIERRLQSVIIAGARAAAGEGENLARRRHHQARGAQAGVACFDDLARRPDQHVGIPDGRHAVLRHRLDADGDLVHPEIDRRRAMGLGEAEERIGHEVLRISGRQITGESPEEFELLALVAGAMAHGSASRRSAARLAGGGRNVRAMALCRQHGADAGVGGRRLGAAIHPGLQVLDAIDDATAEL